MCMYTHNIYIIDSGAAIYQKSLDLSATRMQYIELFHI